MSTVGSILNVIRLRLVLKSKYGNMSRLGLYETYTFKINNLEYVNGIAGDNWRNSHYLYTT